MKQGEAVVFIHGIWMKGLEFVYFSHQLRKLGYNTYHFRYKSLLRTPGQNAELLNKYLEQIDTPVVHLVSHSLGGIVVLHLFSRYPRQKPGKIIMLGSPINGSAAAKYMYLRPWLRWLLGKSTVQGLLGDAPDWNSNRDVFMIAGNRSIGMGMLLVSEAMKEENDGTVNLEETMSSFIKQHTSVRHSHFSMLWSKQVISRVIEILNIG